MPIENVIQPEIIQIDEKLRLRKFDFHYDFALEWYQDEELVYLVDGVKNKYSYERLTKMYEYLNNHGELYFIEVLVDNSYLAIGDITFWKEDMPIVIGNSKYRGQGIGRKVVNSLIQRGKEFGYSELYVDEIYHYNIGSRKCFEGCGFVVLETTDKGNKYIFRMEES